MYALLPLLLPLVVGTATAEVPVASDAPASAPIAETDLVEVHLGANTPGVCLVVRPPASAGPDAEPSVVEVRIPPWPEAIPGAPAMPTIADEPVAAAPMLLDTPTTMASAVPTASYATQPIEPVAPVATSETAFLRHAPVDGLEPPPEPPVGTASSEPIASPAPAPKEVEPPANWVAAADNFEKACDAGHAQACTALADMVADGQSGARDLERAHQLYQLGCDRGDDAACAAITPVDSPSLAAAFPAVAATPAPATPTAPPVDAAPAVADAAPSAAPAFAVEHDLFDACQQGDNRACNELGERHTHGESVSQDYGRAAKLFQRACAGGEMDACTNLGILYKVGEGVSQDEVRADRLFQLACNGGAGDDRACALVEE